LVKGEAYGTLKFVPAEEIDEAGLGPRDILITDQIPNDIPLIAGLITETFQTPLSHVNILSRGRGTPNMGLRSAAADARIAPYLNQLVRLEVTGSSFSVSPADPAKALEYWNSRRPSGPPLSPRLDARTEGLLVLSGRGFADLPSIGGKAAQFAELYNVSFSGCSVRAHVPDGAFAIPMAYFLQHMAASGARDRLNQLREDPKFSADPVVMARGLAEVRALVTQHPVDPSLVMGVRRYVLEHWRERKIRLRSSSNTEDLAGFNGAGLYTSRGVDPEDLDAELGPGIASVWASLFNDRGYAEREYYNVDQAKVAMAVLVHPAFPSERANGVAISRNVLEPREAENYYINAQVGEALVTNPAPGVTSEELIFARQRTPEVAYRSHSSLSRGKPVLSLTEIRAVGCNLASIHDHFRSVLDPQHENSWFAMDVEFKFMGPERALFIKQARPYSFGSEAPVGWCDYD
jgi:hypothetical protein